MTDVPATIADVPGGSAAARKWLIYGGRAALTLALIAGWDYGARSLGPLFFAPPLETAERLWALAVSGQMFSDIMATLRVAVAGFAIAGIAGVILPFLLRRSPRATEAVEPAIMFTMGIPKYALAPWLILWFGIGDMPKLVVVALVVFSIGLTPMITLATDLIVGCAPRERAGAASAISETGAEFGGALGIAVLGSIGVAVYRGRLQDAIPSAASPEQELIASDTLGGATEVAAQLPGAAGAALLDTAREAFVQGMQVTAVTGAVVLAGLTVLTGVLLRTVPSRGDAAAHEPAPGPCAATAVSELQ